MTKANDPFEEYLRKKKVELLENKFRAEGDAEAAPDATDEDYRPADDDPEVEARLREEADDFFEAAGSAAATHFEGADSGLEEEQVEQIRDALEDVFEEEVDRPQAEEEDQNFVDFFRQVRSEYDPRAAAAPLEEQIEATANEVAAPLEPLNPPPAAPTPPPLKPHPTEMGQSGEVSTEDLAAVEAEASDEHRLDLNDILTPPADEAELVQRVELLGRLVARLVEHVKLSENEIVELLIKSGVEF